MKVTVAWFVSEFLISSNKYLEVHQFSTAYTLASPFSISIKSISWFTLSMPIGPTVSSFSYAPSKISICASVKARKPSWVSWASKLLSRISSSPSLKEKLTK